MPKGISNKRKVAEATSSLKTLIVNADAHNLRLFGRGNSLGVRSNSDGAMSVCFTRGSMRYPQHDIDQVENYVEPPLHELAVSDPCMPFSMDACQRWLDSHGIVGCNIAELTNSYSGAALERRVAKRLFSHPGVAFLFKWELLQEVEEVMEEYALDLACNASSKSSKVRQYSHVTAS